MSKKKERKKERRESLRETLEFLYLIFYFLAFIFVIFLLAFGVRTFWIGYHSLDIGQNIRYINCELKEYNITFMENPSEGLYLSGEQAFRLGVDQIRIGFWMVMASSLCIGLFLGEIFEFLKNARRKD